MKKKSSAFIVGLFSLVAFILALGALVTLGGGKYFQKSHKILLYFEKSVYGLQVGSDVRFGGVRIGRVSSISVMIDAKGNRKVIPVIVELTERELRKVSGIKKWNIDFESRGAVQRAVDDGLRAGMKQESLVTGQLYVEFDIVPETKGFVFLPEDQPGFPVVPTIPTETDELIAGISDGFKKINNLDLEGVITEIQKTFESLDYQINQLELEKINENLIAITGDTLKITKDLKTLTGDQQLHQAVANLNDALSEMKSMSERLNDGVDPLLSDLQEVVKNSNDSLARIEEAAVEIRKVGDPRSPALLNLKNLVHETETTSRELKELANDLKRNPSTLWRGKKKVR